MNGNTAPALTVVIPTWNGWDLLHTCLSSLRRQTFQDMEIIVVDDGSTDNTPARLLTEFPEVRCIVSPDNRGFAPTANRGMAAARGAWVFLLNNDVTLEDSCLAKLMEVAQEGTYSMICPLVLWTEDPQLIYSAGDTVSAGGRPNSLGYKTPHADYVPEGEPFGVSGGYGLFRKAMLDEIGLLDEAFVAYFEDSDLCFRARWAGHTATVVMEARAHHIGSASIQGRTWWRTRQCFQNHGLLVVKNFSFPMIRRHFSSLLRERRHQWGRVFRVARSEWGAVRAVGFALTAWWGLMVRVPGTLRDRRRVLGARVIDDHAMEAWMERK